MILHPGQHRYQRQVYGVHDILQAVMGLYVCLKPAGSISQSLGRIRAGSDISQYLRELGG